MGRNEKIVFRKFLIDQGIDIRKRNTNIEGYCAMQEKNIKDRFTDVTEPRCPLYDFYQGKIMYPVWECRNCMHWEHPHEKSNRSITSYNKAIN